jgi:hypothetical protein
MMQGFLFLIQLWIKEFLESPRSKQPATKQNLLISFILILSITTSKVVLSFIKIIFFFKYNQAISLGTQMAPFKEHQNGHPKTMRLSLS